MEVSNAIMESSNFRKPTSRANWQDESQDAFAIVNDPSFEDPFGNEADNSLNLADDTLAAENTVIEKPGIQFMLFDDQQHYRSNTQDSLLSEISDVYLPSEALSEFGFGAWDRSDSLQPNFLSEFNDHLDLSLAANFLPSTSGTSPTKNIVSSSGFNLLQISKEHVRDIVQNETLPVTLFPADFVFLTGSPAKEQSFELDQSTLLNTLLSPGAVEPFDFFSMLGTVPQTLSPLVQQPEQPVLPMSSFLEMMNAPDFKGPDEEMAATDSIEQ